MSKLRKKREKKKKDRFSIFFIILIIVVMTVVIGIMILYPKPEFNDDSMPEEIPDVRGEVIEKEENDLINVQTFSRDSGSMSYGKVENVTIDENADIFWMNRRDDTVERASRADIQIGSRIAVWGDRGHDGTWRARDIGIMKVRSRM